MVSNRRDLESRRAHNCWTSQVLSRSVIVLCLSLWFLALHALSIYIWVTLLPQLRPHPGELETCSDTRNERVPSICNTNETFQQGFARLSFGIAMVVSVTWCFSRQTASAIGQTTLSIQQPRRRQFNLLLPLSCLANLS